jgi:hypothetical protein
MTSSRRWWDIEYNGPTKGWFKVWEFYGLKSQARRELQANNAAVLRGEWRVVLGADKPKPDYVGVPLNITIPLR